MSTRRNDIMQEFQTLTRRDVKSFFQDCLDFFQTDYIIINNYFSGQSKIITSKPFERLDKLEKQRDSYFETIHQYTHRMSGTKWYEIIDLLEMVDSRLQTLRNINRWSRASVTKTAYSPTAQINYTIVQNQTLENVAKNILNDSNSEDSWIQIALDNQLEEEDYSSEGGNTLLLQLDRTINLGIVINSVVDVLSGKSVYGKDLDRHLTIENEDLRVLGYDDTIEQTVEILGSLKKNDNPDYPELGLQTAVAVGGTRAVLNFPIIIRQLTQTFSSDDTLKNFKVNEIKADQDNLFVNYDVMTRLNEIIPTQDLKL